MMEDSKAYHRSLEKYFVFIGLALLGIGIVLFVRSNNGGYSTLVVFVLAGIFILSVFVLGLAVGLHVNLQKQQVIQQTIVNSRITRPLTAVFGALFLLFWCIACLPVELTGAFSPYFIALYPLILWVVLFTGSCFLFIRTQRSGFSFSSWGAYWDGHRVIVKTLLLSLAGFVFILLLTRVLKILETNEPFWRGAGVPILASQVFAVGVIGLLVFNIQAIPARRNIRLDLILFLLIWLITAILWAARPVPASFWVTAPMRPNYAYYPFSDLMTFDIGSQFALIGQGIFNHNFFDRALYMSFLVYLHTIGGQDYQFLMAIQAAIFAIFPAVLYLIGWKLHSRVAGLILAVLTTLRGLNSLTASPWIHSATFKHMLTDFPTAIGLALFVLLLLKWLQSPQEHLRTVFWAGGVLGLTSLLRPHVVLLLPPLLLLIAWVYRSRWRRGLIVPAVTLLAFLASIAPWMIFGPSSGSIFTLYGLPIRNVFNMRYVPATPTPMSFRFSPAAGAILETALPLEVHITASVSPKIPFPVSQYLHNLITSALIFPDSPEFLSVESTVRDHEEFWQLRWNGSMSLAAAFMLILNLVILAFGFGAAYQRLRWIGLIPLAVFFIYHIANAVARTSGGRYLVPVDWILVTYYAIGVAEGIQIGTLLFGSANAGALERFESTPEKNPKQKNAHHPSTNSHEQNRLRPAYRPAMVFVILLLVGGMIPLAGVIYPPRYPAQTSANLINQFVPYLSKLKLQRSDIDSFIKQPGAFVSNGRVLYPRFYRQGGGISFSYFPYMPANYPRMVFVLIGPRGYIQTVLPGAVRDPFPNASDAIVLGCKMKETGYLAVSALAVVFPEKHLSYRRSPIAPLACPVPQPVCDKSGTCR